MKTPAPDDDQQFGDEQQPADWPLIRSEAGPNLIVAQARFDWMENPRTGQTLRRVILASRDWANVVARDGSGDLILVRQFRFGLGRVTTEIPGGVIDGDETPLEAARRELREETGYTTDRWTPLGAVEPNPAFLTNLCHMFLAEDVRLTHRTEPDPGEDLRVVRWTPARVLAAVQDGTIRHSLVISALARVFDLRPGC